MRAALCKEYGTPPKLIVDDVDAPSLREGQVRVDVYACGINFADVLIVQGKYQAKPQLPFVPGGEVSGVVSEISPDVWSRPHPRLFDTPHQRTVGVEGVSLK